MIPLDMRTLVFSYLVTSTLCLLFITLLWRQNSNRFAGTAFWVFDFMFQTAAIVLVILRGTIPDWASMVLSNTLIVSGAILGFMGFERFMGQRGPQFHNFLLLAIFTLVHIHFALFQPNLPARNLNLSVALLLVCFQSVWLAWRRVEASMRALTFGVGATNLLYCLLSSARIAEILIASDSENDYFAPDLFDALILVAYQALLILLTYSFVLMVNRRLLAHIGTQEEKFAKAFHSAPYAITLTRASDGVIFDVNQTYTSVLGYERSEVIGKRAIDLRIWESDADRALFLDAVSTADGVRGMEVPFRRKSGERITALLSAETIAIDGETSILTSIDDISERKRVEERLQKLSRAVEQSPAATVITDTRGRIEYVNPKFLEVTGFTCEELVGKSPAIIKSGLTPLQVYEDLWSTILSGKEWRGEMRNRRKDGELYWEDEIISSLKNERGEIINFIAVKEDITERKRAEETLQLKRALLLQTERDLVNTRESLANADRLESVGRLAAGVAHEVKNPLMTIRLGVDYISRRLSQTAAQGVLDDVRGAIERADNVILELLDFAKQKQFAPRLTDINHVIDKSINLIRHEIKRRKISITSSGHKPTTRIFADPDRLVQVFVNLLSNAAQAIGHGGHIEIGMRELHIGVADLNRCETGAFRLGEQAICVDIIDNGPGFLAEHKSKLFEPFFTTKTTGEGSGLGLAVARNIVIMHNASIDISNRSEGGVSALLMFRVPQEHLTDE